MMVMMMVVMMMVVIVMVVVMTAMMMEMKVKMVMMMDSRCWCDRGPISTAMMIESGIYNDCEVVGCSS